MYIFVNTTFVEFSDTMAKYDQILNNTFTGSGKRREFWKLKS